MRVTFDTNTYRPVVEPDRYSNHPDHAVFMDLNRAIRDGRITPFIGEAQRQFERSPGLPTWRGAARRPKSWRRPPPTGMRERL